MSEENKEVADEAPMSLEERVEVLESVVFFLKQGFETLGLTYSTIADVMEKTISEEAPANDDQPNG